MTENNFVENVKKLEKTGDERLDTLLGNRGFLFKK